MCFKLYVMAKLSVLNKRFCKTVLLDIILW